MVTVGEYINDQGEYYGFLPSTTPPTGAVQIVDVSNVDTRFQGIDLFYTKSNVENVFRSIREEPYVGYEGIDTIYVDGLLFDWYSNDLFTAADVGKTFCISLKAWRPA